MELLGRWQLPIFRVVGVGLQQDLQFGLKYFSLLVIEEERMQLSCSSQVRLDIQEVVNNHL